MKTAKPDNDSTQPPRLLDVRRRKAHYDHSDYPSMTSHLGGLMSEFYKYFQENMEALGLPAPESLFGNVQLALSSAGTLVGLLERLGKRVTVREMIGAGIRGEKLATIAAMSAACYVGAVIGSIAVATGRSLAGGASIADVLLDAQMNHLHRPWLPGVLMRHPEIYKRRTK